MSKINPYAAPLPADDVVSSAQSRAADELIPPSKPHRAFLKWLLVCYLCAIPSFFWGLTTGDAPVQVAGMLCGIFVFVLAYTLAECTEQVRRFRSLPLVNSTLAIGFSCRIAVSLVFPAGMYGDLYLGVIAVNLAGLAGFPVAPDHRESAPASFWPQFVATLIQGALVNLVLFGFMLFVYAVRRFLWGAPAAQPQAADGAAASSSRPVA